MQYHIYTLQGEHFPVLIALNKISTLQAENFSDYKASSLVLLGSTQQLRVWDPIIAKFTL